MGWFDRPSQAAPVTRESKYSIQKIEELLDRFGPLRLEVRNTRLKVLITKVTWDAIPYLMSLSGGKPTGDQLARMMTTFTMLIDTIDGYVKIQNSSPEAYQAQGGASALMRQGYLAVKHYCDEINSAKAAGGDLGSYTALTSYLGGTSQSI